MKKILPVFFVLALGALAYSNTFSSPFQLDDYGFVMRNPLIINLGNFLSMPEKFAQYLNTRYVGYLSFALNYKFAGFGPAGYHAVNLLIHLANAALVFFIVLAALRSPVLEGSLMSGRAPWLAFFTAALFVAHPVQTEAVTYIFQRFASLAAFFCLLCLLLYARWRVSAGGRTGRALLYIGSLLSMALAMKTKENAFTFPLVIALYEFSFFRGPAMKRGLRLLPFLLTMLIIPLSVMRAGSPSEMLAQAGSVGYPLIPRSVYLLTELRVVATYLRLLFFPVNQNLDYDYPFYPSLLQAPVILSLLLHLALIALAVRLWLAGKNRPALRLSAFGIFWFYITLLVESSVIPLMMLINEYRLYLPSVGAALAVCALACSIPLKREALRKAAPALAAVVVLILAGATYARNSVWKDDISLWQDTASKSPRKARVYLNLGKAYTDKSAGNRMYFLKAIENYEKAVNLDPRIPEGHVSLGFAYMSSGAPQLARAEFAKALRLDPGNFQARMFYQYLSRSAPAPR